MNEVKKLKKENLELREKIKEMQQQNSGDTRRLIRENDLNFEIKIHDYFNTNEIERYSRHLNLKSFGIEGQKQLLNGSVLVIGAGGLGCAALTYLSGSGIGRLGIIDHDIIQLNNIHRQIIYKESDVGLMKAKCAAMKCQEINKNIKIEYTCDAISQENAIDLIMKYDVILDCTDNAPTRYLINDACVICQKPLVSGSAIATDGQLTIYNYKYNSPCYRCVFPQCPSSTSCSSCSDTGVLGPVPGTIGILQALEAIKLISHVGCVLDRKLLICDFLNCSFRTVNLRFKSEKCICHKDYMMTLEQFKKYDYTEFTGQCPLWLSTNLKNNDIIEQRLNIEEFQNEINKLKNEDKSYMILDVRPKIEYDLAHITGSINVAYEEFKIENLKVDKEDEIFVICRRGNDSQLIVKELINYGYKNVYDIKDGFNKLSEYDSKMPLI